VANKEGASVGSFALTRLDPISLDPAGATP